MIVAPSEEELRQVFGPRPKVYVTQKPPTRTEGGRIKNRIDLSPARRFGELVFLAHRKEVEEAGEHELLWKMRERLKDFDPRTDYLLPIGHTISMVTAATAALEAGNGTVRMLQWDNRLRQYEVFTLDIHAQPTERE